MPQPPRWATSSIPENITVSPEIHTGPWRWPGQRSRKPIVSGSIRPIPAGPWRAGVAVTVRPFASSTVSHGARPVAPPASRRAPETVVSTRPAPGRSARPAPSRLSAWWSWLMSTASSRPSPPGGSAGARVLRLPRPGKNR